MRAEEIFSLKEDISQKEYVLASYYIELDAGVDVMEKAVSLAIGQTIGTWLPVPGITEEARQKYMGKVISVINLPPADLSSQQPDGVYKYLIQIGYPAVNFGESIPMMLTTIMGNDASTSAQVKLTDIQLPPGLAANFRGPVYGIEGIRKLTGVYDRPLLLNMIKPCTGFSPETGAEIFYHTALGGVDIIKDDELLGNPSFNQLEKRVELYHKASKTAYEKTGKRTLYAANITADVGQIVRNARRARELGADLVMLNFAVLGYSAIQMVAENVELPIIGHYAASGMYYEGVGNGMSSTLALGKLPRLAGADIVMMNTPYGGYPITRQKYLQTTHELTLPCYDLKPVFPSVGGKVQPGIVHKYIKELGKDIILAPGGAIQGHPDGAAGGVKAMYASIEAAMKGMAVEEAAETCPELKKALDIWGVIS